MYRPAIVPPTVLVIGELDRADFWPAVESLRGVAPLDSVADIPQALAWLAERDARTDLSPPEVIVVAQSWPGQFSAEDIDRLRRAAPLVRILALAGTWCDGESRTGNPWPADLRSSWHQWPARIREEFERHICGNCPTWGLPMTTADDERLLWNRGFDVQGRQGLVALHTNDTDMAGCLADACRVAGYTAVRINAAKANLASIIVAGIWDAASCDVREIAELRALATFLEGVPVIALLGFPRAEDCQGALSAGAAAVLSKPLLLDDLHVELSRITSTSRVVLTHSG